ncbi:MAG: Bax inhibitor-1/YccA family protein [Desulfobacteraceae bacterium]|nr:Bax inhibitor-1/YccA family protein [Desulfobacteraceae bacterium]
MDRVSFQETSQIRVNGFIQSVYNWMAAGLGLTAVFAYIFSEIIFLPPALFFVAVIVEIGMVFYLSSRINKIQASTATALFMIYAALNGITISWLVSAYTPTSVFAAFFVCAATFTATSIFGMVTKKDLTGVGNFMVMGLIGIIIASLVNIFVQSSAIFWIINYVGVIVFVGLTAYDTQKIKEMALSQPADLENSAIRKGAILGALSLYLDFINLFIMMLRIMGDRE